MHFWKHSIEALCFSTALKKRECLILAYKICMYFVRTYIKICLIYQTLNRTKKLTIIFLCVQYHIFDYWKPLLWARIEQQVIKGLKYKKKSGYQKRQQFLRCEIYKRFYLKIICFSTLKTETVQKSIISDQYGKNIIS